MRNPTMETAIANIRRQEEEQKRCGGLARRGPKPSPVLSEKLMDARRLVDRALQQ